MTPDQLTAFRRDGYLLLRGFFDAGTVAGIARWTRELAEAPEVVARRDVLLFDSYVPHASRENLTPWPRRILYLTYNRLSDGDRRERYYRDKFAAFPPDIARIPGTDYVFRV